MEHHIRFLKEERALYLLDQRYLPEREEYFVCRTTADVIEALQEMVVRGAPAIGVTAAYGCVLAAWEVTEEETDWKAALERKLEDLAAARPTAVNLRWAVEKMRLAWQVAGDVDLFELRDLWSTEAEAVHREDVAINWQMGNFGARLLAEGDRVMTHCNAGALATAGCGTALGVIRAAVKQGKKITVVANETRPFLQGARLTAYELHREEVPVTVACDNAAALLMKKGLVDKIIVGADRIAANGDVANKIGTYGLAVLARAHKVPFYVAAPLSTIDAHTPSGELIPIEERPEREVTHVGPTRIVPEGVAVYNFAFDVTPAELVTAIITERGVLLPPYRESIAKAKE
ncbi:MAG: S-methyl-5-thioribose-1-phosphate isomerase [Desulfovibrionales bacterium]